jgi:hypothetical protein
MSLTYQVFDKNKYFIQKSINLRLIHTIPTPYNDRQLNYSATIIVNALTKNMETWRGIVKEESILGQYISDQRKRLSFTIGMGIGKEDFQLFDIQTNYRVNNYLRLFYDFRYQKGYGTVMSFIDNVYWVSLYPSYAILQTHTASARITFSNKSDLQLSFLSQHVQNRAIFHQSFRLSYQYQFSKMGLFNVSVQAIDYTNFVGDKTPRFSVGYIQQFKR